MSDSSRSNSFTQNHPLRLELLFMKNVRAFVASVTSRQEGKTEEQEWPVYAWTHEMATRMAFAYVIQVLKIQGDFELRVVGS